MRAPAILYSGIAALALALALVLATTPAPAQEEIHSGVLTFCNTPEQLRRVIVLTGEATTDEATAKVNEEFKDAEACATMPVFFLKGEEAARERNKHGAWAVVRIGVVGIMTPVGPRRVPLLVQFGAFKVPEQAS